MQIVGKMTGAEGPLSSSIGSCNLWHDHLYYSRNYTYTKLESNIFFIASGNSEEQFILYQSCQWNRLFAKFKTISL